MQISQHDDLMVSRGSAYAEEMRRHEALHGPYGAPLRPFVQQDYPMQMYKAERGGIDKIPRIVGSERAENEQERSKWEALGYVAGGQGKAFEALERQDTDYGKLAAERAYEVQHQRVSARAAAEIASAEAAAGATHLPTIPEQPTKRRGRKPAQG